MQKLGSVDAASGGCDSIQKGCGFRGTLNLYKVRLVNTPAMIVHTLKLIVHTPTLKRYCGVWSWRLNFFMVFSLTILV